MGSRVRDLRWFLGGSDLIFRERIGGEVMSGGVKSRWRAKLCVPLLVMYVRSSHISKRIDGVLATGWQLMFNFVFAVLEQ